jgi:exosortase/archaeosortase family protein
MVVRRPRLPRLDERARFAALFVLIAGVLLTAYYAPREADSTLERWTGEYLRVYTRMVSFCIAAFDRTATSHGNIVSGRFSMQIVKSCDAMEANILFAAAVLAIRARWWRKAVALAAGLAALAAANVTRLVTLYAIGTLAPSAFDFMHYEVWPLVMVAVATAGFMVLGPWASEAREHVAG